MKIKIQPDRTWDTAKEILKYTDIELKIMIHLKILVKGGKAKLKGKEK